MNTKIIANLILALLSIVSLSLLSYHDLPKSPTSKINPSVNQKYKELSSQEKRRIKEYKAYSKILIFYADLEDKAKGKLIAIDTKKAKLDGEFKAVSGVGINEKRRGIGPTPSQSLVTFDHYTVNTKPLYLTNKGIEGNFYQLSPFRVKVGKSSFRGDFGIHADRNVPGTAGCIGVIDDENWVTFKKLMGEYRKAGVKKVPLLISYS